MADVTGTGARLALRCPAIGSLVGGDGLEPPTYWV